MEIVWIQLGVNEIDGHLYNFTFVIPKIVKMSIISKLYE